MSAASASLKRSRGWTLGQQVFVLVAAFVTFNLFVIAFAYAYSFESVMDAEFARRAQLVSQQFSGAVIEGVALQDERLLEERARDASQLENVILAVVYDEVGTPLAISSEIDVEIGRRRTRQTTLRKALTTNGTAVMEAMSPVVDARHGRIGSVRLLFLLEPLEKERERILLHVVLLSLAGMILISLVGAHLIGIQVEKPIRRLVEFVTRLTPKDYGEQIVPTGGRETIALADAFNEMSQRIQRDVKALSETEESLRTILDSIGDAVIGTDSEGRVTWLNPIASRLIESGSSEAIGRKTSDLFHLRDESSTLTSEVLHDRQRATVEANARHELVLTTKGGEEYRVLASGNPRKNSEGVLLGAVLIFQDVTEEVRLRSQLDQSRKMDALGQLAGGVAHDLNNMLTVIVGGTELLRAECPSEQGQESAELVVESCERAEALIKNLLDFSRRGKVQKDPVDVNEAVQRSVALLSRTLAKRIRLGATLAEKPQVVLGDVAQLQSALLNLGINASHAMPEGGELQISTREVYLSDAECHSIGFELRHGHYVEIKVEDSGVGIAPQDLSRIFEPFFTTRAQGEGTGLGLAAVYGTAKRFGGAVTVQSEVGTGTVFRLLFPRSEHSTVERQQARSEPPVHRGRVLVVDDEPTVLHLAVKFLTAEGYEVLTATDGQSALELFRSERRSIEAVLLDMLMPGMSGESCFVAMQEFDKTVPVGLSSGFTGESNLNDLKAAGVFDFLPKPYRRTELLRFIARLIESRAERKNLRSSGDTPSAMEGV